MEYKLNEILFPYSEKNTEQKYFPVAVGKYGIRKREDIYKKELAKDFSKNKVIRKNTLTIGMGSTQIDIGILDTDDVYSVSPAYHTYKINTDIVIPKYLDWLLKCVNPELSKMYMIASARQGKSVDFERMMKHKISIPSLEEQEKINKILSKIYEAKIKFCEVSQKYNDIVKSQFIEMFGNLKDTVRLGDCCDVHARIGWQALTTKEHRPTGDYMLITGTDFKDNEIDYSTCVYVEKDRYEMDPHIILKNDDVLITKDGTIGKVAIVHNLPKPATLNGGVFVVRPDERFNKEYIAYVFKGPLFEEYVEKSKTGATIKHLNQKHLVEFNIPVPSIDKQVEFAKFAQQIDKSKFINYSRYFLWEFLTLFSSTIAYSSVVSILA